MIFNKSFLILVIFTAISMSCSDDKSKSESNNNSALNYTIDSLKQEINKLKTTENSQNFPTSPMNTQSSQDMSIDNTNETIHAFVVFTFKKKMDPSGTLNEYPYCSHIQKFNKWNEDIEYKFMDENLPFSTDGSILVGRKCYVYKSYAEASKEREKILFDSK